jgi:hypothetical protein
MSMFRNPEKKEIDRYIRIKLSTEKFSKIPQQMIKKACRSVIQRLQHCIEHNGEPVYITYR